MEPIYDRTGKVVGWFHDYVVYDRLYRHRAFVLADAAFAHRGVGAVFSYQGSYLGHVDRGFFRDRAGHAVGWIRGADGGPVLPVPETAPAPPLLPKPPMPPAVPAPPPPMPSLSWSGVTWDDFLRSGV